MSRQQFKVEVSDEVFQNELYLFNREPTSALEVQMMQGMFKNRMEAELKKPTPGPVKALQIDLSPSVFLNCLWAGIDGWQLKRGMANKKLTHKFWYYGKTKEDVLRLRLFQTCEFQQLNQRGTIMRMELEQAWSQQKVQQLEQAILENDAQRAAMYGMTVEEYREDMRREWAEEDEEDEDEQEQVQKKTTKKRKRANPPPPFRLCYIWEERCLRIMFRKTKCNPNGNAT